jgi:hypothetical protein
MKKDNEQRHQQFHRPSQLFLVRLWLGEKEADEAPIEWYGKVQHVVTGESYHFHSSSELIETLLQMMRWTANVRPGSQS